MAKKRILCCKDCLRSEFGRVIDVDQLDQNSGRCVQRVRRMVIRNHHCQREVSYLLIVDRRTALHPNLAIARAYLEGIVGISINNLPRQDLAEILVGSIEGRTHLRIYRRFFQDAHSCIIHHRRIVLIN